LSESDDRNSGLKVKSILKLAGYDRTKKLLYNQRVGGSNPSQLILKKVVLGKGLSPH
jgi:hypothetical protein